MGKRFYEGAPSAPIKENQGARANCPQDAKYFNMAAPGSVCKENLNDSESLIMGNQREAVSTIRKGM